MNSTVPQPQLSIDNIIVMVYSWLSHICYAITLYRICTRRKQTQQLQTPFFTIFILNSIGDFALFLSLELVQQPRKYRYFGLFDTLPDIYAEVSHLLLFFSKTVVILCFLPLAANRFSAFVMATSYESLWKTRNIVYIYLFLWFTAFSITLVLKSLGMGTEFTIHEDGILQLTGHTVRIEKYFSISLLTIVVFVCLGFFLGTAVASRRGDMPTILKNHNLEFKLLVYALCTSLPLLAENIRCWFYATTLTDKRTAVLAEIGYHLAECTTSLPFWSLLLLGKSFIKLILIDKHNINMNAPVFKSRSLP